MCQKGEIIALISPFCDVFRSFLFGLYLFHHPEEISTPYLGDVCFCKSMFQQTDGDIDEIIVPIASFDPASTVEVRANAHVVYFMKSVRLVFLASGFRNSSTRQA